MNSPDSDKVMTLAFGNVGADSSLTVHRAIVSPASPQA
jgi:hypothetical protein